MALIASQPSAPLLRNGMSNGAHVQGNSAPLRRDEERFSHVAHNGNMANQGTSSSSRNRRRLDNNSNQTKGPLTEDLANIENKERERSDSSERNLALRQAGASQPHAGKLVRARTEQDLSRGFFEAYQDTTEQNWELRHGWEDQYNSEEYLHLLSSVCNAPVGLGAYFGSVADFCPC